MGCAVAGMWQGRTRVRGCLLCLCCACRVSAGLRVPPSASLPVCVSATALLPGCPTCYFHLSVLKSLWFHCHVCSRPLGTVRLHLGHLFCCFSPKPTHSWVSASACPESALPKPSSLHPIPHFPQSQNFLSLSFSSVCLSTLQTTSQSAKSGGRLCVTLPSPRATPGS